MSRGSVTNSSNSAAIQFFRGTDETAVPDIRLTRSRDGRTGQAFFSFDQPDALINPEQMGEITGMILLDEEGELISREVKARFVNGSPSAIEALYTWRSEIDFERFMRFAERYAKSHGLGYSQTGDQSK